MHRGPPDVQRLRTSALTTPRRVIRRRHRDALEAEGAETRHQLPRIEKHGVAGPSSQRSRQAARGALGHVPCWSERSCELREDVQLRHDARQWGK